MCKYLAEGSEQAVAVLEINAGSVFVNRNESHYRFHNHIDAAQYPQVHDFYEFVLMTAGTMELIVEGETYDLSAGALALLRPGSVHAKRDVRDAQHINLAFPSAAVESLFDFLGLREELRTLNTMRRVPIVQLSPGEAMLFQTRLKRLALLPSEDTRRINATLRAILLNCMTDWFIPMLQQEPQSGYPDWFDALLLQLENPANLAQGMDFLVKSSGKTTEHLCRSFRKYLGVSPNAYLNMKRLNYAANLLRHSDHNILDIAYEAGFSSESAFYHNFTSEYGMSPGKYRKTGGEY